MIAPDAAPHPGAQRMEADLAEDCAKRHGAGTR